MNNTNLLRDLNHVNPNQLAIGWSAQAALVSRQVTMNSDGIVNQTKGSQNEGWTSLGGSNYYASGLLMSQPIVDDTPYRVKIYASSGQNMAFFVGYAPLAPTGLNDLVTKISVFPLIQRGGDATTQYDDIVLMPGLNTADPDFGKPLAFGLVIESAAAAISAYHMSVQNLAKTAPQFAASMS